MSVQRGCGAAVLRPILACAALDELATPTCLRRGLAGHVARAAPDEQPVSQRAIHETAQVITVLRILVQVPHAHGAALADVHLDALVGLALRADRKLVNAWCRVCACRATAKGSVGRPLMW